MTATQFENPRARREVLQVMYTAELTGSDITSLAQGDGETDMLLIPEVPEGVEENELVSVSLVEYGAELLADIAARIPQIDEWIVEAAENWTLDRMPIVDRSIIRLAAYEMAFRDDIPVAVAIDEAVELAKAFGGDDSPKFVNGVLGRIATRFEQVPADDVPSAQEAPSPDDQGGDVQ